MAPTLRRDRRRVAGLRRHARLLLAGVQEALLRRHHASSQRGNSDPGLMT